MSEKGKNTAMSEKDKNKEDDLEVGLLDEAAILEREKLQTLEREVERELLDYRYRVGLLLIDTKKTSAKHDQLMEPLLEAEKLLKCENTATPQAQLEEREPKLLERSLRLLRAGNEKMKKASEAKVADANKNKMASQQTKLAAASNNSVAGVSSRPQMSRDDQICLYSFCFVLLSIIICSVFLLFFVILSREFRKDD